MCHGSLVDLLLRPSSSSFKQDVNFSYYKLRNHTYKNNKACRTLLQAYIPTLEQTVQNPFHGTTRHENGPFSGVAISYCNMHAHWVLFFLTAIYPASQTTFPIPPYHVSPQRRHIDGMPRTESQQTEQEEGGLTSFPSPSKRVNLERGERENARRRGNRAGSRGEKRAHKSCLPVPLREKNLLPTVRATFYSFTDWNHPHSPFLLKTLLS